MDGSQPWAESGATEDGEIAWHQLPTTPGPSTIPSQAQGRRPAPQEATRWASAAVFARHRSIRGALAAEPRGI